MADRMTPARWRAAVEKVAILAAEDDTYLPIFAAADAYLREAEARDPIELARARTRRAA